MAIPNVVLRRGLRGRVLVDWTRPSSVKYAGSQSQLAPGGPGRIAGKAAAAVVLPGDPLAAHGDPEHRFRRAQPVQSPQSYARWLVGRHAPARGDRDSSRNRGPALGGQAAFGGARLGWVGVMVGMPWFMVMVYWPKCRSWWHRPHSSAKLFRSVIPPWRQWWMWWAWQ